MILSEKVSSQITNQLATCQIIDTTQKDIYKYCFTFFFDIFFYNIGLLLIGILLNKPLQALMFACISFPGKTIVGGAHASSPAHCSILSYGIFILTLLFVNTFQFTALTNIICYTIFSMWIILLSPVDHPNKRLNLEQKHRLKRISCIFIFFVTLVFFIMICFNHNIYYNLIMLCMCILAWNQVIGIIQNRRANLHEARYRHM